MIFINYLAETNEDSFRKVLLAVENGERFHKSLETAYNKKWEELWNQFLNDIEMFGEPVAQVVPLSDANRERELEKVIYQEQNEG